VLIAVGPKGELVRYEYELLTEALSGVPARKPWVASATLGYGLTTFTQGTVVKVSQSELSAKVGYSYSFRRGSQPARWQAGVSAFGTVLPLSTTPGDDFRMRYLGLNARVGYLFGSSSVWEFGLHGGLYYNTMFTPGVRFGYRNLMGPQLYPTVRRSIGNRHGLAAYLKFSPVSDGLSFLSLSSRELASGLRYGYELRNGRSVLISVDYARIDLVLGATEVMNSAFVVSGGFAY
jgi:hypothetical protein